MKLWILRHGEAGPYQSKDAERQLTARGRQQVLQAAEVLQGVALDAVLSSPFVRARQTTDVLLSQLGDARDAEIVPWLTPDSSVAEAQRYLGGYPLDSMLIVGHQPLLGNLASWLCEGTQQGMPLGTASLLCLEGDCLAAAMRLVSAHHASC